MTEDETPSRPISVAELLAKNGTIGSPPVGGRRRRRRGNSDAVTVAELTGEIPIIRTGETPVVHDEPVAGEPIAEETAGEPVAEETAEEPVAEEPAVEELIVEETAEEQTVVEPPTVNGSGSATQAPPSPPQRPFEVPPQRSEAPTPRRDHGPEPSYDPRPVRRPVRKPAVVAADSSDAEQMTFDPVDESAPVLDLAPDEQVEEAAELQSYLRSSSGTLFGGETVADDRARRGLVSDHEPAAGSVAVATEVEEAEHQQRPREGKLTALWRGTLVVLQSILAVVFGAGLFIAFDQLWRWNNIVALVLSVLVILSLVIAVRLVRKTEDIASTLIAVAVGALVTLGPLALLQST